MLMNGTPFMTSMERGVRQNEVFVLWTIKRIAVLLVVPLDTGNWRWFKVLYDKKTWRMDKILPVMFVPLVGKFGFKKRRCYLN
jgi:hypothetical protein